MKIKQTVIKEMTLDEVIRWAWENNIVDSRIKSDNHSWIYFDEDGDLAKVYTVEKTDIFPVETTEEIEVDKTTKFDLLIEVYENVNKRKYGSKVHSNSNVMDVLYSTKYHLKTRYIYTLKPDGMPDQLLWANGKMAD